ncbi:MAG: type II secretion system protein GspJ [Planctomycetaceae bacterium]
MRVSTHPFRGGLNRRGFTLLEVMVALGMSVLLVTAIYSAISLYIRVSQADASVIERSRVARALFRQMTLDIQSVLFRVSEEESDESSETSVTSGTSTTADSTDGSSADASSTTETITAVDPESAVQSTSVGLIGDAVKLTLHINRPARDLNYSIVTTGAALDVRTSDLQSVTYFLANASSSGLEGEVGQQAQQQSGAALGLTESGPQGLARLAGDRMAIDQADQENDLSSLAQASRVLAPEVVSLSFRYFDGLNWQTEWDSVAAQRLPNAVEVRIGMKRIVSEDERLANQFNPTARAAMNEVLEIRRHVVALPLAEPYVEAL